jgi:YgiT-type zinc finger domain-containing protein
LKPYADASIRIECSILLTPEEEMKCIICHGEDVEFAEAKEELRIGNDIVYVPIRVLVCQVCGERYYDRRTLRYLEEVEQKLREGKANLQEVGKVLVYS